MRRSEYFSPLMGRNGAALRQDTASQVSVSAGCRRQSAAIRTCVRVSALTSRRRLALDMYKDTFCAQRRNVSSQGPPRAERAGPQGRASVHLLTVRADQQERALKAILPTLSPQTDKPLTRQEYRRLLSEGFHRHAAERDTAAITGHIDEVSA